MCADYKSSNAREIRPGRNEDETSGEDENDSDQTNIKTEKVKHRLMILFGESLSIRTRCLLSFIDWLFIGHCCCFHAFFFFSDERKEM